MKKVAVVGFASSSRTLAPFNDDAFEIWTMNHAPLTWIPKWHALFEMHSMEHLRKVAAHSTDPSAYLDWLTKQPGPEDPKHCPIYMLERAESIPASVPYPRVEVNGWFAEQAAKRDGYFAPDYYTSTISYMLALAMMQGREEIHLYGIDLLQDDEYIYQRAGAEYLIGLARGTGIKVYVPEQSALCKAGYVYGYTKDPDGLGETAKESPVNILTEYVADKANTCEGLITKSRQDANTFHGAMQMADLVLGWLDKGGDGNGKDTLTLVKEKKADLETKFKAAHEGVFVMQGQAEAFKTVAVWGKHLSRGGSLKS